MLRLRRLRAIAAVCAKRGAAFGWIELAPDGGMDAVGADQHIRFVDHLRARLRDHGSGHGPCRQFARIAVNVSPLRK